MFKTEYILTPRFLFTKKSLSCGYMNLYHKPKTVRWPSQVYDGNPYTDKTVSS